MGQPKKKRMSEDRKRQVQTIKERYGTDHYQIIGRKAIGFTAPYMARKAAWKRWHPERFDDDGTLRPEFEEMFNADNN